MRLNKRPRITSLHKKGEGGYATHHKDNFFRFFAQSSKYRSINF